jgi:hypothetical protein
MQVFISTIVISKETLLFKYADFTSVFTLKDHAGGKFAPKKAGKTCRGHFLALHCVAKIRQHHTLTRRGYRPFFALWSISLGAKLKNFALC